MNNEQSQQIIFEAYKKYYLETWGDSDKKWLMEMNGVNGKVYRLLTKEEFIGKCKADEEFSDKWGLKIEERELSLEERHELALPIWKEKYGPLADMMVPTNVDNAPYKIPTKLITLTYKDKTIEVYE